MGYTIFPNLIPPSKFSSNLVQSASKSFKMPNETCKCSSVNSVCAQERLKIKLESTLVVIKEGKVHSHRNPRRRALLAYFLCLCSNCLRFLRHPLVPLFSASSFFRGHKLFSHLIPIVNFYSASLCEIESVK